MNLVACLQFEKLLDLEIWNVTKLSGESIADQFAACCATDFFRLAIPYLETDVRESRDVIRVFTSARFHF